MIFLIEYKRQPGEILSYQEFDDADRSKAQAKRLEMELAQNRQGVLNEIVILQAKDKEALKKTHARYFMTLEEMLQPEYFLGAK